MDINNYIKLKYNDVFKLVSFNNDTYDIKLLKYDIILNLKTDFDSYCIILENNNLLKDKINKFNITIIFKDKTLETILNNINQIINYTNKLNYDYDYYHIYKNKDLTFCKVNIDYLNIKKLLLSYNENSITIFDNIPKNLLFNRNQIVKLLINEIIKINQKKEYNHYINILNYDNPYILSVTLCLQKSKCKKVEFDLIINPYSYPFYPPILKYKGPNIKTDLLINLTNLDILKIDNWILTITLEYIITNIANQLELYIDDYIINDTIVLSDFDKYNEELKYITHNNINKIINISVPNKIVNNGIGYSTCNSKDWDIKSYINLIQYNNEKIYNCLKNIYNLIIKSKVSKEHILKSYCMNYILYEMNGINMLEYNKKPFIYEYIFKIINELNLENNNGIFNNLKILYDELELIKSTLEIDNNIKLIETVCKKIKKENNNVINDVNYVNVMKQLLFDIYKLPQNHLFYKYSKEKIDKDTIKRISLEISSFKNGLPLSYDSCIWVRVSKENINFITFIISGPKDTPYENGLFEFHAYLPNGYPNEVPKVLLKTTNGGKVRFNPNLYDNGKVCLSLLNTWEGNSSEKWNPNTSTFLQVMISIQSLILIEEPYFNEPGCQINYGTPIGKKLSNEYNNSIYPNTVKTAMINIIENPPIGFENVVKNHFKFKNDEINKTLIKWGLDKELDSLNKLINKL